MNIKLMDGDKELKPRLEYQTNGKTEKIFVAERALALMLADDVIFLNEYHWMDKWPEDAKKVTALCVNCNDVFAWASVDAEDITYCELEDLYEHWEHDPVWGPSVWCIKRRGEMPQPPVYKDIMKKGLWDLDSMGLNKNTTDAYVQAQFAAYALQRKQQETEKEEES